jgi:alginate O-acetyltransferase complex protein AlgI
LGWLEPIGLQFQGWQNFSKLPDIGGNNCIAILGVLVICVAILPNTQEILHKFQPSWKSAIVISTLAVLCLLSMNRISEFLYFQF